MSVVWRLCLCCLCLGPGVASCGGGPAQEGGRLGVFAGILPHAGFLERIGGEHVEVGVLVGPGQSPHAYEPTPKQMTELGRARLYVRAGLPFEDELLRRIRSAHPDLEVVDTAEGLARAAGTEGGHGSDHGELDPHVWLDPKLARRQAERMADALCRALPEQRASFRARHAELDRDLERLDRTLARILAPLRGRTFYVFHPAFGYFARSYGLRQKAVETGGKSPGPRHVHALVEQAREEGVRVIFVQPQFDDAAAQTLARQIDGAVVPLNPLARDYLANLASMGEILADRLGAEGGGRK